MNSKQRNEQRAHTARCAIDSYRGHTGMQDEEISTVLTDLLCDLMHLADEEDLDFDAHLVSSLSSYTAEINGE